jgi:hypothetical protein
MSGGRMISVAVVGLKMLNVRLSMERASHPLLEPTTRGLPGGKGLSAKERCMGREAADGQHLSSSGTRRRDGVGGTSAHRHAVQAPRELT